MKDSYSQKFHPLALTEPVDQILQSGEKIKYNIEEAGTFSFGLLHHYSE